jgi:hypothetical protein
MSYGIVLADESDIAAVEAIPSEYERGVGCPTSIYGLA